MTAAVTFWNVGQGDCTALHDDRADFRMLMDGGTAANLAPRIQQLVATNPRLDLVVSSHPDRDHIEGLIDVVSLLGSNIGQILLPPLIHPTHGIRIDGPFGPSIDENAAGSPWMADHLRNAGLGRALGTLNELARRKQDRMHHAVDRLVVNLQDAGFGEEGSHSETLGRADDPEKSHDALNLRDEQFGEEGSRSEAVLLDDEPADSRTGPEALHRGSASRNATDAERTAVVAQLAAEGLDALSELVGLAQTHRTAVDPAWTPPFEALMPRGERIALAAFQVATDNAIRASLLQKLLTELESKRIPMYVRAAPDRAYKTRLGINLWHIAPTEAYIRWYSRSLPTAVYNLFVSPEDLGLGLSTPSNRLSHVLVAEADGGGRVLLTGDSTFDRGGRGRRPDTVSREWEKVVNRCSLIDVPHHGGSWGHFATRAIEALRGSQQRQVSLYVSAKPGGTVSPPNKKLDLLGPAIRAHCGLPVLLAISNRPASPLVPDIASRALPTGDEGPSFIQFDDSSGRFELRTSGALTVSY